MVFLNFSQVQYDKKRRVQELEWKEYVCDLINCTHSQFDYIFITLVINEIEDSR